jgi:hypothetical protein
VGYMRAHAVDLAARPIQILVNFYSVNSSITALCNFITAYYSVRYFPTLLQRYEVLLRLVIRALGYFIMFYLIVFFLLYFFIYILICLK